MKRILNILTLYLLVVILSGVGYYGYQYWQKTNQRQQNQMSAQAVDVVEANYKSVYPEADFVAKIQATDKVGLRARVTGFLQKKMFDEGDIVQKGQPLFLIEPVNFQAQVRQAEANLAKAEANAVNARAQYERAKTLFKTKDVPEAKLDEAQAVNDTAQATVAQMKAALDLAKKDLEYTTIVSPMDGKIGEKAFSVGELIGPNSGVLAEIVSINPINAVFSVSENQLGLLQEQFGNGRDVDVEFIMADGRTYPERGKIKFVDIVLDEAMNTLKMKASFPNPEQKLISGQYGRVRLIGKKPIYKIIIPMKSVQRDLNSSFVYVVNSENKIEKRVVKTGLELPNFDVIIESGLTEGERVVTAGFQKIAPDMTVTPSMVK
jgi:membrane fusion protein (multidrug efflux system)